MFEILKDFLWMLLIVGVAFLVILYVGNAQRLDVMKESIAAGEQARAELWQTVDGLKGKVKVLEGYEILLIMRTGREITIRTEDGQILKCYFPDEPIKKEGLKK